MINLKRRAKSWANDFDRFLQKSNFMDVVIGLVIATSFRDVVFSFTNNIIGPIMDEILQLLHITNPDAPLTIFGVEFKLVQFTSDVIGFFMVLIVAFMLVKIYIAIKNDDVLQDLETKDQQLLRQILEKMDEKDKK